MNKFAGIPIGATVTCYSVTGNCGSCNAPLDRPSITGRYDGVVDGSHWVILNQPHYCMDCFDLIESWEFPVATHDPSAFCSCISGQDTTESERTQDVERRRFRERDGEWYRLVSLVSG